MANPQRDLLAFPHLMIPIRTFSLSDLRIAVMKREKIPLRKQGRDPEYRVFGDYEMRGFPKPFPQFEELEEEWNYPEVNPHFWTDEDNVPEVVQQIEPEKMKKKKARKPTRKHPVQVIRTLRSNSTRPIRVSKINALKKIYRK